MTVLNWSGIRQNPGDDLKFGAQNRKVVRFIGVATPALAILMLLLLLGVLLWLVNQSEHERQRDDLIRDTLWVEQTLEFHRNTDQENLDRLALELGD
ncbi:MAG: hypothetical protein M3O03_00135, partial [Pseudomonadota bacterium]|nr:hypothetical protein [Pseudomonadota bacterium]